MNYERAWKTLKAEIAALAEAYSVFEDKDSKALSALLEKLRQLSAI
jgi:hypothetical protein